MKDQYAFPHQPGTPPGMELRDCFAGMALQGLIAGDRMMQVASESPAPQKELALWCYEIADAMMEMRNKEYE